MLKGKMMRAELAADYKWPYSTVKSVYDANKDKFPGWKLVVANADYFESGPKPCGNFKAGGVVLTQAWGSSIGFAWSGNDRPVMGWNDLKTAENFIGTIPAFMDGRRLDTTNQAAGVQRRTQRTWWGFDAAGTCYLEVTTDGYQLEEIKDRMAGLGIVDGLVLDGSGSSQSYDGKTYLRGDGRTVYSFLLVWFAPEDGGEKKTEDKMKTVCIDPGHGGTESANGSPDGTYKEHEFTLDLALRLRKLLTGKVNVLLTRTVDMTVALNKRAQIANEGGTDVFVSLHSNAAAGTGWSDAHGLCAYTYAAGGERDKLANAILDELGAAGVELRATRLNHAKFTVLANTTMPAVLVEYLFHNNKADVEKLKDTVFRDKLATATAKGICGYLGIAWDEDKPAETAHIYRVQAGAFTDRANAESYKQKMVAAGFPGAFIVTA